MFGAFSHPGYGDETSPADHVPTLAPAPAGLSIRRVERWLDLPPGATLGVTGAAGAFGGYVVQLAKADELRTRLGVDRPVLGKGPIAETLARMDDASLRTVSDDLWRFCEFTISG